MAATLSSLVAPFLDKLRSVIQGEVGEMAGMRSELEELESKIKEIQCLLADAEGRAFYSEAIRVWLKELKEVMYDADDIVDDCKVAGAITASEQPDQSSPVRGVRTPLSSSLYFLNNAMFKHKIGKRLEGINSRLEMISRERSQFQLTPNLEKNKTRRLIGNQTSSVVVNDIIGEAIQVDSRKLIKALIEVGSGVDLIAITGMGGIGKTTLAQVIYNNQLISASFQMTIWVCVSKDVAGAKLLKKMVACTGVEPGEAHSTEQLQLMLRSLTQGKKILLVLDDIWSADVWENLLRDPVQGAAAGSKVLITTRFETVAKQVGAVHLHPVAKMNPVEGWFLLCKRVCIHGEDFRGLEYLKDVGVKIVERCDGLPLAIKVIGGVLRGRGKNREDWEEVLHSRTWSSSIFPEGMKDMVMEALHLSYEDLPPHLKQCFLYLSLFPEDHVFKRPNVVQQWIAEGFVKAEGDASTLEEIGREYFKELVDRSLLQPEMAAIEGAQCKMHDLLRSLAQFLAEDENFFGSTSDLNGMLSKLRRLSVADGDADIDLDALKSKECLRSLFLLKNPQGGLVLKDDVIATLGHLRVLDLSGSGILELPHSIRNLRHLRYLDVSRTAIRELPECVADLRSLEFLLLNNCRNVSALPSGITKLVNLRSLEAYEGTQIDEMPSGIGRLRRLRNLKDFVVDRQKGALEELGSLVDLYLLSISKLERVSDKMQARSAALQNKTRLLYVSLECTLSTVLAFDVPMMTRMVDVFDELRPPPSLEILQLDEYMGHTLPRWMWPSMPSMTSPIHNLTILLLNCCFMFSQLPPLGLLPHLKTLFIKSACVVTSIIPEPQDPAPPTHFNVLFPVLEKLTLLNMPNLEKIWDWRGDGHEEANLPAFPRLQNLCVDDCPKLRRLPDCPSSGLKVLHVEGCPALMEVGNLRVPDIFNVYHGRSDSLPPWLRQVSVGPGDHSAFLNLKVRSSLLERMLRQKQEDPENPDGDWHVIKRFPRVFVAATDDESKFLTHIKDSSFFNTNVQITDCSSGVEERGSKKLRAERRNDGAKPSS
ncbi:hypothetical protein Taro_053056 [Colocasia esculenta]|uniref:Disease resistance protein RGA3 n=1 Tax=Colocasia esculenta TaxID=4460 RepID=A0A843XLH5_COLES|nr:hypothetical protein [Colocasia esculenta]